MIYNSFLTGSQNISDKCFTIKNVSQSGTYDLGVKLSCLLKQGDTILLKGDFGSGKTYFARAFIKNRLLINNAVVEDVPSPSFTIVQVYDSISPSVWHIDLYRLSKEREVFELGLEESFSTSICLIEWPEKLGKIFPKRNILILFEQSESNFDNRNITVEFSGEDWNHLY